MSLEIRLVELHVDELDESGQATYRSAVMKLAYLAQDRPELAYAMKGDSTLHADARRGCVYGLERAVRRFCMGTLRGDQAGCRRALPRHGRPYLLRFSSAMQTVVALSSGESMAMGAQAIVHDLGKSTIPGAYVVHGLPCEKSYGGSAARRGAEGQVRTMTNKEVLRLWRLAPCDVEARVRRRKWRRRWCRTVRIMCSSSRRCLRGYWRD